MVPSASYNISYFQNQWHIEKKIQERGYKNYRTTKVGMNIWRSRYPLSWSEQAQPEQAAQGQSRWGKAAVQLCPGYLQG